MADWEKYFMPSHIDFSDDEKLRLTSDIESALKEVLGTEPEDIMTEYLQVMIINSKNFAEISQAMVELMEEDDCKKLAEIMAKKLKKLVDSHENNEDPPQEDKVVAPEKATKSKIIQLNKSSEDRDEEFKGLKVIKAKRQRGAKLLAVASAYTMFLHSGYPGSFHDYQEYLQGIPLEKKRKQRREYLAKMEERVKKRGKYKRKAPEPAQTYEDVKAKMKKMSWSREGIAKPAKPDATATAPVAAKPKGPLATPNKSWVRPEIISAAKDPSLSKSLPSTP